MRRKRAIKGTCGAAFVVQATGPTGIQGTLRILHARRLHHDPAVSSRNIWVGPMSETAAGHNYQGEVK